jgi:hypothetical protein
MKYGINLSLGYAFAFMVLAASFNRSRFLEEFSPKNVPHFHCEEDPRTLSYFLFDVRKLLL